MIQLKNDYTYINRGGLMTGKLLIEITSWITYPTCRVYTIEDFLVKADGSKIGINSRQKTLNIEELRSMDALLPSTLSSEPLTTSELDWLKAKLGLLLFVQYDSLEDGVHTIYGKLPEDWEYSPEEKEAVEDLPL